MTQAALDGEDDAEHGAYVFPLLRSIIGATGTRPRETFAEHMRRALPTTGSTSVQGTRPPARVWAGFGSHALLLSRQGVALPVCAHCGAMFCTCAPDGSRTYTNMRALIDDMTPDGEPDPNAPPTGDECDCEACK